MKMSVLQVMGFVRARGNFFLNAKDAEENAEVRRGVDGLGDG